MDMTIEKRIETFLSSPAFGVVGASTDREKYGNKVLRVYLQHHKKVYPVNPNEKIIEGMACVPDVKSLPADVKSISIITPPAVTEKIVQQAIAKGIENIWMQPGAESDAAIKQCEDNHINVIAKGPCLLVTLGFHDDHATTTLQEILNEWQNSLKFREEFKQNPEQALKNAGFEVSPADLAKILAMLKLDKTKNEPLDGRINK